jgi:hypothetical protein
VDVFDGANDPEDGFDEFIPHNEGTGLQNTQVIVLNLVQIQPPVSRFRLVRTIRHGVEQVKVIL